MLMNSFGYFFCVIIWGESYGFVLGVMVDGCFLNVVVMFEML